MGDMHAEVCPAKGSFLCEVKDRMFKGQKRICDAKQSFSIAVVKI